MPEVEIMQFIRDERGFKVGYVDFKITYDANRVEEYRNWAVFIKEDRKWISDPKVKREIKQPDGSVKEEWVSVYKRTPPLAKDRYSDVLSLLEKDHL